MPTFEFSTRGKNKSVLTLIQWEQFDTLTKRLKKAIKVESKRANASANVNGNTGTGSDPGVNPKNPRGKILRDLENAANPDDGLLPIHWACKNGPRLPKRTLKALIDACPKSVKEVDSELSTPLHFLTYYGFSNLDALKILVKAYPDAIILMDICGRTPIFHAVEHEHTQKLQVLELLLGSNMKAAEMLTIPCGPLGIQDIYNSDEDYNGFHENSLICPSQSRGIKFKQHNFPGCDQYWTKPVNERCPLHMMWSMALASSDAHKNSDDEEESPNSHSSSTSRRVPRMNIIRRSHNSKMQKALLLLEFAYLNKVGGAMELRRAIWRRRMAKKFFFSKRMLEKSRANSDGRMYGVGNNNGHGNGNVSRRSVSPSRTIQGFGVQTIAEYPVPMIGTPTNNSSRKSRRSTYTLLRRRAETIDASSSRLPSNNNHSHGHGRDRASTADVPLNALNINSEGAGRGGTGDDPRKEFQQTKKKKKSKVFRRLSTAAFDVRNKFRKGGRSTDNLVATGRGRGTRAAGFGGRDSLAAVGGGDGQFAGHRRHVENLENEDVSFASSRDNNGPFLRSSFGLSNLGLSEDFSQYPFLHDSEIDFSLDSKSHRADILSQNNSQSQIPASASVASRRQKFRKKKFRPFRNKRKMKRGDAVKFRIVHAVVLFHESLPDDVLDFALLLKPEQLDQPDEGLGNLPLHIATSINAHPNVVGKLIFKYKDAATVVNVNGQLPLHLSLCARWNVSSYTIDSNDAICIDTIHTLLRAYPSACAYMDPITGLYPFMLAAANLIDHDHEDNGNGRAQDAGDSKTDTVDGSSFYKQMRRRSLCSSSRVIFEHQSFRGSIHSSFISNINTNNDESTERNSNATTSDGEKMNTDTGDRTDESDSLARRYSRQRLTIVYELLIVHPECIENASFI